MHFRATRTVQKRGVRAGLRRALLAAGCLSTGVLANWLSPPAEAQELSAPATAEYWSSGDQYSAGDGRPYVMTSDQESDAAGKSQLYTSDQVRAIVREELAAQAKNKKAGGDEAQKKSAQKDEKPPADKKPDQEKKEEDEGTVVGSDLSMKPSWNNGFEVTSPDKAFRTHVGGRVQMDGTWFTADDAVQTGAGGVGRLRDSWNFRRARLRVDGTMWEVVDWAAEFDFVNTFFVDPGVAPAPAIANNNVENTPAPTDLWVTLTKLPMIGNLRMGNLKEPIGMEHLTSSRFLEFMERSYNQDAFYGPFNNGFVPAIMAFDTLADERITWASAVSKNTNNIFGNGVGDGEYAYTNRVTLLPLWESDGRYLVHLGLSSSLRDLDESAIRVRSRGSLRSGNPGPFNPVFADSGTFIGDNQTLVGAEFASQMGPVTIQSEYTASFVKDGVRAGVPLGSVFFQGWYVETLWFLTGEHRTYNRKTGVFDRVVPAENYFRVATDGGTCFGRGAWQLGARYSMLDLKDPGINGGILHDVTLGLNWFLNPNMKVQWNYIVTDRDANGNTSDGLIQGVGTRVAFDF